MKKLIKLSDYYYVIDINAEIKDLGEYYIDNNEPNEIVKIKHKYHLQQVNYGILKLECVKVICTTNPSLPLPQITNASDDMVGKEVEVELNCKLKKCVKKCYPNYPDCSICENNTNAILKPISKESKLCSNCKHCGSLVCKLPGDRYANCIDLDRKLFEPKETSTNETLEEVAMEHCWNKYKPNRRLYEVAFNEFIAGYKHAESKMYSEMDMFDTMQKFCEDNKIKVSLLIDWFSKFQINNNKK